MELTIKVTLKPEIELGEYKGLSVEKKEAVVEDADVDAAVEELRSRQAKMVIAEHPLLSWLEVIVWFSD